jgi:hypothetical protein
MSPFAPHSLVRVRKLLRPQSAYDDWKVNRRPPQVGDVGCLVEILRAPGLPDRFVVECAGPDAATVWLSDLAEDEIEPAAAAG